MFPLTTPQGAEVVQTGDGRVGWTLSERWRDCSGWHWQAFGPTKTGAQFRQDTWYTLVGLPTFPLLLPILSKNCCTWSLSRGTLIQVPNYTCLKN